MFYVIFACISPVCRENVPVCYKTNLKRLREGPVEADSLRGDTPGWAGGGGLHHLLGY